MAPVPDVPNTTPSISDCAPAFMGTHSRPRRVTTCARSAKFFRARNCAFSLRSARRVFSVSRRSARIDASAGLASSRRFPPGISTHLRISGSRCVGMRARGRASRRRGSATSSAWSSETCRRTAAHAATVVAMSARELPLRTRPRAAPATKARMSRVPSKTSRGSPPRARSVAAAVVSASNLALSSGVAPRGSAGVHARTPSVVAVNARTCAESSGHWRSSRASASRSSAEGGRASSSSSPSASETSSAAAVTNARRARRRVNARAAREPRRDAARRGANAVRRAPMGAVDADMRSGARRDR